MAGFLRGLFIVLGGGALIYYAADLVGIFGRSVWMEQKLGGTRAGYMLFGFIVMIIGFLIMFGIVDLSSGVSEAQQITIGG